jgi:hypothetical protein
MVRTGDVHGAAHAAFLGDLDAFERDVVVGDEEILAEEEVQFAGRENAIFPAVIDGVNHHE